MFLGSRRDQRGAAHSPWRARLPRRSPGGARPQASETDPALGVGRAGVGDPRGDAARLGSDRLRHFFVRSPSRLATCQPRGQSDLTGRRPTLPRQGTWQRRSRAAPVRQHPRAQQAGAGAQVVEGGAMIGFRRQRTAPVAGVRGVREGMTSFSSQLRSSHWRRGSTKRSSPMTKSHRRSFRSG